MSKKKKIIIGVGVLIVIVEVYLVIKPMTEATSSLNNAPFVDTGTVFKIPEHQIGEHK